MEVGDALQDLLDQVRRVFFRVIALLSHPASNTRPKVVSPRADSSQRPGRVVLHLSSSSPPVTSSVTKYTFLGVMYTSKSLMQLGWSTCDDTWRWMEAASPLFHPQLHTLIRTWISLSKLLSPAAYRDLSTTCGKTGRSPSLPHSRPQESIKITLMATGAPVCLSLPFFTTAKPMQLVFSGVHTQDEQDRGMERRHRGMDDTWGLAAIAYPQRRLSPQPHIVRGNPAQSRSHGAAELVCCSSCVCWRIAD